MRYELVSEEKYKSLPEDKEQYFVAFENICHRSMMSFIDKDTSNDFDRIVRAQYMAAVSAVADECGVPNVSVQHITINNNDEEYNIFLLAVQRQVAKVRVREHRNRQLSVSLAQNTRIKIEHHIGRIREVIDLSDLTQGRKQLLHNRLDELVKELKERRLSFGKTLGVLSVVMASIASTITIAADGADAINNIVKLISIDKESEDAAIQRLAAPLKALPAPVPKPPAVDELDDDIPF